LHLPQRWHSNARHSGNIQEVFVDFRIAPEDRLLADSVRAFVEEEVNPRWQEIDREDRLPSDVIAGVQRLGLFGMSVPPEYGGLGLSVLQKALVHEQLGRGPWGLASFVSVHTGIGCVGIVRFGSAEQKQRYLPKMATGEWLGSFALTEPEAGSDAGALRTQAERVGDHWVLRGRKIFITNAPLAHQYFLFARTARGISAFIVDRDSPGLQIGSIFDTLGHQGSQISEVVLDDCRSPASAPAGVSQCVVARPGQSSHSRIVHGQTCGGGKRVADGGRCHANLRRQRLRARGVHDRAHLARRTCCPRVRRVQRSTTNRHRPAPA
jgi:alkylation response protein AidB-like acyl-CoA dehydrogenase